MVVQRHFRIRHQHAQFGTGQPQTAVKAGVHFGVRRQKFQSAIQTSRLFQTSHQLFVSGYAFRAAVRHIRNNPVLLVIVFQHQFRHVVRH